MFLLMLWIALGYWATAYVATLCFFVFAVENKQYWDEVEDLFSLVGSVVMMFVLGFLISALTMYYGPVLLARFLKRFSRSSFVLA
jgi:hypothetical protein